MTNSPTIKGKMTTTTAKTASAAAAVAVYEKRLKCPFSGCPLDGSSATGAQNDGSDKSISLLLFRLFLLLIEELYSDAVAVSSRHRLQEENKLRLLVAAAAVSSTS
jgi:hypothetical protein